MFPSQLPTPEELSEWATVVLTATQTSAPSTDADARSLLATLTKEGVRRVLKKKMAELVQMAQMVENKYAAPTRTHLSYQLSLA